MYIRLPNASNNRGFGAGQAACVRIDARGLSSARRHAARLDIYPRPPSTSLNIHDSPAPHKSRHLGYCPATSHAPVPPSDTFCASLGFTCSV